jgi:hypothetical protein
MGLWSQGRSDVPSDWCPGVGLGVDSGPAYRRYRIDCSHRVGLLACRTLPTSTGRLHRVAHASSDSSALRPRGSKTQIRSIGESAVFVDQAAEQVRSANVSRAHQVRRTLRPGLPLGGDHGDPDSDPGPRTPTPTPNGSSRPSGRSVWTGRSSLGPRHLDRMLRTRVGPDILLPGQAKPGQRFKGT